MRAACLLALLAMAVAGCGGGGDQPEQAREAPPQPREQPREQAPPAGPRLPEGVPTSPDGPAPAGSERVIRAWLAAVRRADFEAAADTFARGAKVQNGGPVARLRTRAETVLWNAALPCGATLTSARGARGYAIVQFKLVDRPGAACGSGRGAPAYGAIRVRDGRITEWYRLPDPVAPPGSPDTPFV
jgi:limonene-1,2-epoxide hydrolase